MIKVYKEISNWWYLAILVGTVAMALATTYAAKSGLPWWAFFVALIFAWMFVPIIGTVSLRYDVQTIRLTSPIATIPVIRNSWVCAEY